MESLGGENYEMYCSCGLMLVTKKEIENGNVTIVTL